MTPIILLLPLFPVRVRGRWRILLTTLFTNSDSPVERRPEYEPGRPLWLRRVMWWGRNPLHDFTFYVIGFAGREIRSWGSGDTGATLQEGLHWAVRRPKGWPILLPYLSYQRTGRKRRVLLYVGWRPQGAFGLKARIQTVGGG